MRSKLDRLLAEIRACQICAAHLPLGPRPVLQASATARLLIVSQAPGRKVHLSGVPFADVFTPMREALLCNSTCSSDASSEFCSVTLMRP